MLSLDPPAYIASFQNNIRARPISWEGAVRARTITDADLKRIKSIDKVRKEQRRQTIENDLDGFCKLFLGGPEGEPQSIFQTAAKRQDIVQYLLVLVGDLIDDIEPFATTLVQHPQPYAPFLPLLTHSNNPEDPIPLLTSSLLKSLLSHALSSSSTAASNNPNISQALPKLQTHLSTLAKSSDSGLQDIAVQSYSAILRTTSSRKTFWSQRTDTLNPLIDILRSATGGRDSDSTKYNGGGSSITDGLPGGTNNTALSIRSYPSTTDIGLSGNVSIQLLYHVLLVLWQLSFEGSMIGPTLDSEHDIIPLFAALLRISPKEKITRLVLATLRNLLSTNRQTLLPSATSARLQATLGNIKGRHLSDPDVLEDLNGLKSLLEEYSKEQTTFDEYAAEVRSGHLRWSPPHKNVAFWKENARRIVEEDKGELCKQLAEVLGKSWEGDRQVLAVGCSDVAYLVREVPDKKGQMEKWGLKGRVMALMGSEDETVRWEALRAVGEWLKYSFDG